MYTACIVGHHPDVPAGSGLLRYPRTSHTRSFYGYNLLALTANEITVRPCLD